MSFLDLAKTLLPDRQGDSSLATKETKKGIGTDEPTPADGVRTNERNERTLAAWSPAAAAALEAAADDLVDQLGVSGTHPDVRLAVADVLAAHRQRDAEAHRRAVGMMNAIVRQLARGTPR